MLGVWVREGMEGMTGRGVKSVTESGIELGCGELIMERSLYPVSCLGFKCHGVFFLG